MAGISLVASPLQTDWAAAAEAVFRARHSRNDRSVAGVLLGGGGKLLVPATAGTYGDSRVPGDRFRRRAEMLRRMATGE